jgi:hypothetical protein
MSFRAHHGTIRTPDGTSCATRVIASFPGGLGNASVCEPRSECYNSTEEVYQGDSRLGFNLATTG